MLIKIKGQEFQPSEIQRMIDAGIQIGEKHDVLNASPDQAPAHGLWYNQNIGGVFSRPGIAGPVPSAIPMPTGGLFMASLFAGVNEVWNPEYDIITGAQDATGDNATDYCDDPPQAGFIKLCTHRRQFGKFFMQTPQISLNETGGRINSADVDRQILNNPAFFPLMPDPVRRAGNLNVESMKQLIEFGIHAQRVFIRTLFHGAIGNTGAAALTGFIREFDGLDQLITTGYTDLDTGDACAAADSTVLEWANADVGGTLDGADIVETMSYLEHIKDSLAEHTGSAPVQAVLAMHDDLFFALTRIWPCSYLTDGCTPASGSEERLNVGGAEQVAMRDAMRTGKFLWINGKQMPVITTTAIEQTAVGAGFSSPIYRIPLTALGRRVTWLEGFNQNNGNIREFVNLDPGLNYSTMNGGFWAMASGQTRMCYERYIAAQPRLIMQTPYLAWRIDDVNYSAPSNLYQRSAYPADQYFVDGGRYFANTPTYN